MLFNNIENKKKTWDPCFYAPSNSVVGVPLVLCIEDNACLYCRGRCTLVERNYALVICSMGQNVSKYASSEYYALPAMYVPA